MPFYTISRWCTGHMVCWLFADVQFLSYKMFCYVAARPRYTVKCSCWVESGVTPQINFLSAWPQKAQTRIDHVASVIKREDLAAGESEKKQLKKELGSMQLSPENELRNAIVENFEGTERNLDSIINNQLRQIWFRSIKRFPVGRFSKSAFPPIEGLNRLNDVALHCGVAM
jgi:hypothetical protein